MIIKFQTHGRASRDKVYASQDEVRNYIQDMIAELSIVAGQSGLQDVQAFLSVTHKAIIDAGKING